MDIARLRPLQFAVGLAACTSNGESGLPGAPYALAVETVEAGVADVPMPAPPPLTVALVGKVEELGSDAGMRGAVVIVEVGGLDQANPAGLGPDGAAVASLDVDPFILGGAVTDDMGAFSLSVPAGTTGIHTLAPAYVEGRESLQVLPPSDAAVPTSVIGIRPLTKVLARDGGTVLHPTVTALTASSSVAAPTAHLTFTVRVAAGNPDDPLSEDIFILQPATGWAGALVPPSPAVPGGPYPDGVYNRIVEMPSSPGTYTYVVVAASMQKVTSFPASVVVNVTPTGLPPTPDAGLEGGEVFLDGGGLPDNRY